VKKNILLSLCAVVIIVMIAFAPTMGGSKIDYPYMLMVDDVLYVETFTPVTDVQEEDILGYTKSYTKGEPRRNGQANFGKGTAYASAENGLAVQRGEEWFSLKHMRGESNEATRTLW